MPKYRISQHEIKGDWCHICGQRRDMVVDVHYAENAEHNDLDDARGEYIRICVVCAAEMVEVATDGGVKSA